MDAQSGGGKRSPSGEHGRRLSLRLEQAAMTSDRGRPPVLWGCVDSTTGLETFYDLQDLKHGAPPSPRMDPPRDSPDPVSTRRTGLPLKTTVHKFVRYAAVSVISTTVSLSILGFLVATRAMSAGWANIVATSAATVPSFELNRRWVWKKVGQRSLLAEVGPFCALSFAGLALSTVAVSLVASWATSNGWSNTSRTLAAEGANIVAFGSLWLLQFALLDRVLFKTTPSAIPITGQL
jgi:putative flippase GtrA